MEVERAREFTALSLAFACCTESPDAQILRIKHVSGREKPTTGRKTQRAATARGGWRDGVSWVNAHVTTAAYICCFERASVLPSL